MVANSCDKTVLGAVSFFVYTNLTSEENISMMHSLCRAGLAREKGRELVSFNRCFEPSKPLNIISGEREKERFVFTDSLSLSDFHEIQ